MGLLDGKVALITGRTALSLGLVLNDIPLSTTETSLAHAVARAGQGGRHLDAA